MTTAIDPGTYGLLVLTWRCPLYVFFSPLSHETEEILVLGYFSLFFL